MNVQTYKRDGYFYLRKKWYDLLTGGDAYDINDSYISKKIDIITNTAQELFDSMIKATQRNHFPYIWEDLKPPLDIVDACKSAAMHIKLSYIRLEKIALAYATKGSVYYQNEEIRQELIVALDFMYDNWYNETIEPYGNWWDWDIGSPLSLNNIAILLYDHLTNEQIANYMHAIDHFVPHITTSTGANRVWKATIIALRGIIGKESAKIIYGRDAINPVLPYVTEGDGFYKDGSFIQHDKYGYTGNYGEALINNLSKLVYLLSDSPWEVTNPELNNLYNWIIDSFEPLIYKGAFMDALRGRQISGYKFYDHIKGQLVVEIIALISVFAPPPYVDRYKSMVKSWIQDDWYLNYFEQATIFGIMIGKSIVDSPITPREPLEKCYAFSAMDRVLHRRPGFGYMIAMHSSRIRNYEMINNENHKGWHTGDGMTYLYNNDLARYADDFWPTVDSHRLPGTTCIYGEEIPPESTSDKDFAGGCHLDHRFSIAGMELHPPKSPLFARKSWFMFDDEIVALGSDIHLEDENPIPSQVETTIDNYKLRDDNRNNICIDGEAISRDLSANIIQKPVNWLHLEGNVADSDVGYYFPYTPKLSYKQESRTDSYSSINTYNIIHYDLFTRNYFTLWFNHGNSPKDENYAYVVLPNYSMEATKQYAENPQTQILVNNNLIHAVKKPSIGIIGANFWTANTATVDGITCSQPASIIMQEDEYHIQLSVSDVTWKATMLTVKVDITIKDIIVNDSNITTQILDDYFIITVNVNGAMGQTFSITANK